MLRFTISLMTVLCVLVVAGFSSGVLTRDVRQEESCAICRAVRYTGRHYGVPYERIENGPMTEWYRSNIDPRHGRDPMHPHVWKVSACTVTTSHSGEELDHDCVETPPIFLIRPDVERAILEQVPDRGVQIGLISSLNDPDRAVATARARRLIEYYYEFRERESWDSWWQRHHAEFGM